MTEFSRRTVESAPGYAEEFYSSRLHLRPRIKRPLLILLKAGHRVFLLEAASALMVAGFWAWPGWTVIGDLFAFLAVVAAVAAILYARGSARAAEATIKPMEAMAANLTMAAGTLKDIAGSQATTAETMRATLAMAEKARQADRLYQELARQERLMGIVKSIWFVLDRESRAGVPASGRITYSREAAGEVDALLYQLRAALAVLGRHAFPNCHRLSQASGASVSGMIVNEAEQEVQVSLDGLQQALNALLMR